VLRRHGTVPGVDEPRRLKASEIKVGDIVGLWNGSQVQNAEVIEDRGGVGMGGRRIFRVRVASTPQDAGLEFEVPLDSLVAPSTAPEGKRRRRTRPSLHRMRPA
jgi:hypothetical protein